MELSKALRTAYYQLLNGSVLHNGNPVPVYDAFPLVNQYPYILISSQTSVQEGIKRDKGYEATVLIDIVTGSLDRIGRAQSEDIAEQVENIINPEDDIAVQGYQIISTTRDSDGDLTNKNEMYFIYRKLMRYRHKIFKQ